MARKRMIDPNFWKSEDIAALPIFARLVFIGMFSNADDYGKGRANAMYLRSTLFPYDEKMRVSDINKAISQISTLSSVQVYEVNGNHYYKFTNWLKWQKVEKPSASLIPEPNENSVINRGIDGEVSPTNQQPITAQRKVKEEKGREEKGKEGERARELTTSTFNLDSFFELYKQHAPTLFKKDFPDGIEKSDGSCVYESGQLFFSARADEYNPLTEEKTITLFEKAEASDYIQSWTKPILVTVLKLKEKVLSGKYEKNFKGGQYGKSERPKADIPELGQTF